MSLSKIRNYSLPTCTLKIGAKKFAPFRGISRSQQKDNYFELYFNDPDAKDIIIKGDRLQLQQLSVAVNDYVQQFLALRQSSSSKTVNKSPANDTENNYTPSLQLKSLLAHELFFGSLATEKSGKRMQLTPLQLFDLATALEKYATDAAKIQDRKSAKRVPSKIFAASAIAAFGLGAIAVKLFNPPLVPQTQTISSSRETALDSQPQEAAETTNPFEVLPPNVTEESDNSKPSLPTPTQNRSESEKLPPPPPVIPPKPTIEPRRNVTIIPPPPAREKPEITSLPTIPKPDDRSSGSQPYIIDPNAIESQSRSRDNTTPEKYSQRDPVAIRDSSITQQNTAENQIIAEANRYLLQKWQPPADLDRTLEYRLIINKDGSIAAVIPLGYPSKLYRDRSGIPLPGEAFLSQGGDRESLKMRVFLSDDGKVNTFLEN